MYQLGTDGESHTQTLSYQPTEASNKVWSVKVNRPQDGNRSRRDRINCSRQPRHKSASSNGYTTDNSESEEPEEEVEMRERGTSVPPMARLGRKSPSPSARALPNMRPSMYLYYRVRLCMYLQYYSM